MSKNSGFSFDNLNKKLSKIDGFEMGSILEHSTFSEIDHYIPLGNYLLNAQISGTLFGGIPNTKTIGLSGDPGTGKTFLCLNACREAQKMGYSVIYAETEGAIDRETARKFGIDTSKIRYQPIKTVLQFRTLVNNILLEIQEARKNGEEPRIFLVLDSVGMLSTEKEVEDAMRGKSAQDMGLKAKELRSLFRTITLDLTGNKIPFVMTNHTGCLTKDHEIIMSDGEIKNIQDIKPGNMVKTLDGNKMVLNNFEFDYNEEIIQLELSDGSKLECTKSHKFLVKNTKTLEFYWKPALNIEEDEILLLFDKKTI